MYEVKNQAKDRYGARPTYGLQELVGAPYRENSRAGVTPKRGNPYELKGIMAPMMRGDAGRGRSTEKLYATANESLGEQHLFGHNKLESMVLAYQHGLIERNDLDFVMKATVASYLIGLLPTEIQKPMYQGLAKVVVEYLGNGKGKKQKQQSSYRS